MGLKEGQSINNKTELIIRCDLCDLFMYNNNIEFEKQISNASENGIYICSICARKMAIQDLKAISMD